MNFSRHPGCDGRNYRGKNITPNNTRQTLEGKPTWKSVKGFQIKASSNKVQVAIETRLLQSKSENEAVLLILFGDEQTFNRFFMYLLHISLQGTVVSNTGIITS